MDEADAAVATNRGGLVAAAVAVQSEHDAIKAMLQAVDKAVFSGASGETIALAVEIVILFCRLHFQNEEALMRECKHGQLATHMSAHAGLLQKLQDTRDLAKGEDVPVAALDFLDLLHDFEQHIESYDQFAYYDIAMSGV